MNEAQTCHELITPALQQAGWDLSQIKREVKISQGRLIGQGKRTKPLYADYILQYRNRNLAVIEAKARDKHHTEGLSQAKDYAQRLHIRFTYATNGEKFYGVDMQRGTEGDIVAFPSPEALWAMTFPEPVTQEEEHQTDWNDKLLDIPYEDRSGTWELRYYQNNAINKVIEAIAAGKDRILLTLATGTGKTAIAFQIAWKLFHARWNLSVRQPGSYQQSRLPRILFLADRNILADQAFNAFSAFEDNALIRISPADIRRKQRVPKNGSIFFTIFQTFMSGPDGSPYFGDYPRDFFDFIIIDECHRGGANDESTWRAILEYFSPAVQLGLTATPRRDVNGDTYAYFGEPVYTYALMEGINDGFLTPFRVREIRTTIDEYRYTSDDDIECGEIDEARTYTIEDQNRIIEIREAEAFRVKLLLREINPQQKSLVFCATQVHALVVRDLINELVDNSNPLYCCRVTADEGGIGEQRLREFQDNEKSLPTILTTSHKLSTGVDTPEVRNIVLMRPVNSMVEFKQIIGRGTRLYDGKDYFTIYDFVRASERFQDSGWDGPPLPPEVPRPGPISDPCPFCGQSPCICVQPPPEPCPECGNWPCTCERPKRRMIRVKLSDHKVRELDAMVSTSFWSPDGKPISAGQFIQNLFGDIPQLFRDEDELRRLWSVPGTRRKLLNELNERGYSPAQLDDLKRLVHGEDSDLYDVLAYVAWQREMLPRLERAERARIFLNDYDPAQQEFLNFVLDQYVRSGVDELDDAKLPQLITLKYNTMADAKVVLGNTAAIREVFVGFQGSLYHTF